MAKKKSKKDDLADRDEDAKLFVTLYRKKEDVIPELKDHVRPSPIGGLTVHHPLVICMNVGDGRFAIANYTYRAKKAAADKALSEKDYVTYILLHERPYQVGALMEVSDQIGDNKTYWELLGELYTDSENPWEYPDEWDMLLRSKRRSRKNIMTEEEQEFFLALPNKIPIYRGFAFTNRDGWSWTLDEEKAEWFANRFAELGGFPQIVSASVNKKHVVAYFDRREEKEILVSPEHVTVKGVKPLIELEALDEDELENLKTDVITTHQSWISKNRKASIGDLSAYLHKAHVQCAILAERGDPEIDSLDSIPEPLKSYLDSFGDHDDDCFSYRLENLNEDQQIVHNLLRAVGSDVLLKNLK